MKLAYILLSINDNIVNSIYLSLLQRNRLLFGKMKMTGAYIGVDITRYAV